MPFPWIISQAFGLGARRRMLRRFPALQRGLNVRIKAYNRVRQEVDSLGPTLPARVPFSPGAEYREVVDKLLGVEKRLRFARTRVWKMQNELYAVGERAVREGKLREDQVPKRPGLGLAVVGVVLILGLVAVVGMIGIGFFKAFRETEADLKAADVVLAETARVLADWRKRVAKNPNAPAPNLPALPGRRASFAGMNTAAMLGLAALGGLLLLRKSG